MAKVILEFDPLEDREEMEVTLAARKLHSVLWDVLQDIRSQLKYNENNKERDEGAEWVRSVIWERLEDEGLANMF